MPISLLIGRDQFGQETHQRSLGLKIVGDAKDLVSAMTKTARQTITPKIRKEFGLKGPFKFPTRKDKNGDEWFNKLKWNNCPVTIVYENGQTREVGPKDPSKEFFNTREENRKYDLKTVEITVEVSPYKEKAGVYDAGLSFKIVGIKVESEDCDEPPEKPAKKVTKKRKVEVVEDAPVISDADMAAACESAGL